jgi:hypothetical protein
MLRPFFIFLLLFFEACTMLKSSIPKDAHLALSSVQVLGEGKGRLGIKGQQYVFGLESLLNEKQDWILSASIPLHGEEILAFKNLKQKKNSEQEDSLEKRIESMLGQEFKDPAAGPELLKEMRQIIRFILSDKLNLIRTCAGSEKTYTCQMDGETYELLLTDQKLSLSRTLASGKVLNLIAENPGAKFYGRTNFFLTQNKNQLFSLELFWK